MIDTQADISVIKYNSINNNKTINFENTIKLKGITTNIVHTLGSVLTSVKIGRKFVPITLHVVENNFPISADGILGKDFIKSKKCILDFSNFTLTFRSFNENNYTKIFQGNDSQPVEVPARCEVFRCFNIGTFENDRVIEQQEIAAGVFLPRTIVSGNKPILRILNTTDKTVTLNSNINIKSESLNNYHVVHTNVLSPNRSNKVMNILKNQFPKRNFQKLYDLCKSYTDIFALEDEKLTVNNFYEQKINLSDKTPVYIKNYRLPYTHKAEINKQIDHMLNNNIIEHSTSSYNSPLILVPKKATNGEKNGDYALTIAK